MLQEILWVRCVHNNNNNNNKRKISGSFRRGVTSSLAWAHITNSFWISFSFQDICIVLVSLSLLHIRRVLSSARPPACCEFSGHFPSVFSRRLSRTSSGVFTCRLAGTALEKVQSSWLPYSLSGVFSGEYQFRVQYKAESSCCVSGTITVLGEMRAFSLFLVWSNKPLCTSAFYSKTLKISSSMYLFEKYFCIKLCLHKKPNF